MTELRWIRLPALRHAVAAGVLLTPAVASSALAAAMSDLGSGAVSAHANRAAATLTGSG